MNRLMVALGIVAVVSSLAMGFSEDFESYDPGDAIAGENGWTENYLGDWFEANATVPGTDPGFLGTRYADLGNNTNGTSLVPAILTQTFTKVTGGSLIVEYDACFRAAGPSGLESCNMYLSDGDRTSDVSETLQAAAISVGQDGLVVDDGGWQIVQNFDIVNGTWYHAWITVDMDARTWQLAMAAYDVSENLGTPTTVYYLDNDNAIVDTFAFRDPDTALDDIGMIEFSTSPLIMNDGSSRGFYVDNINVPEPATLSLLAVAGVLTRRRKR